MDLEQRQACLRRRARARLGPHAWGHGNLEAGPRRNDTETGSAEGRALRTAGVGEWRWPRAEGAVIEGGGTNCKNYLDNYDKINIAIK